MKKTIITFYFALCLVISIGSVNAANQKDHNIDWRIQTIKDRPFLASFITSQLVCRAWDNPLKVIVIWISTHKLMLHAIRKYEESLEKEYASAE